MNLFHLGRVSMLSACVLSRVFVYILVSQDEPFSPAAETSLAAFLPANRPPPSTCRVLSLDLISLQQASALVKNGKTGRKKKVRLWFREPLTKRPTVCCFVERPTSLFIAHDKLMIFVSVLNFGLPPSLWPPLRSTPPLLILIPPSHSRCRCCRCCSRIASRCGC